MRGPFPTIPIQRVLKGANDVRESELWIEEPSDPLDPWGKIRRSVNIDLIKNLARGPIAGDDDLESAMSLARLVRGAYTSFGTDGTANVEPEESRIILRALKMMLERRGLTFDPPWRDYDSFKSHWVSVGASGSGGWQARRDIIGQHFAPIIEALEKPRMTKSAQTWWNLSHLTRTPDGLESTLRSQDCANVSLPRPRCRTTVTAGTAL